MKAAFQPPASHKPYDLQLSETNFDPESGSKHVLNWMHHLGLGAPLIEGNLSWKNSSEVDASQSYKKQF